MGKIFNIGDVVLFGRPHGEKTRAMVVKVNRVTLKVELLEKRGRNRTYPIGDIWTIRISDEVVLVDGKTAGIRWR